jgi:hypothetical protein
VELTGSQVTVGPNSAPSEYHGHVTRLRGSTIVADLTDATGRVLTATVQLQLPPAGSALSGTVQVSA